MSIISVTQLYKNLSQYIKSVIENDQSFTVTTKRGNVVLISEEEYRGMIETLYLVSQKGILSKIKEGEKEDIDSMTTYRAQSLSYVTI